ncbi:MAG: hypothetical protein NTZ33_15715 [Bacteroidetes bacterium]|nr:hypothetical protein [Bacteroidota bacterium]
MKKFAVIELLLEMEDKISFSCCNIMYDTKEIIIKEVDLEIDSFDDLPAYVFNTTVLLSIHGKGIITKDIHQVTNMDEVLSTGQSYTQTWITEDYHLLSMIRQELMNKYLTLLFEMNIHIKNIYLGAAPLLQLIHEISENKTINTYSYSFVFDNQKQLKISSGLQTEKGDFVYKNTNYPIKQSMLISIALLENNNKLSITDSFNEKINLKSRFLYNRYFKLVQRTAIFLFFTLLLINFLIFKMISQKNTSVNVEYLQLDKLKSKEDSLRRIINEQEKKNTNVGNKTNFFLSILTDRIASTIPEGIKLSEINVNPSKFLREQKVFRFDFDKILVNGYADNSYLLNQWLKLLENKSLITKSNVITYKQESGLSNGYFELEFYYNNQWLGLIKK